MRKWIPLVIVAAAVIASLALYSRMPATVPTHWDMLGRPNGWSSRQWGAWVMPVVLLVMALLVRFLPGIDPRGSNYLKFSGAFEGIIISVMLFTLGLHVIILLAALGYPVAMERVMPLGIGVLFVVIGNLLPRARPNWFVGIRTPWTLSSDRVWEKTHRFGGKVFVATGILIVLGALLVPSVAHIVMFCAIASASASVLVYSYMEWKKETTPTGATP
jgi:uncharacterized membrane protein